MLQVKGLTALDVCHAVGLGTEVHKVLSSIDIDIEIQGTDFVFLENGILISKVKLPFSVLAGIKTGKLDPQDKISLSKTLLAVVTKLTKGETVPDIQAFSTLEMLAAQKPAIPFVSSEQPTEAVFPENEMQSASRLQLVDATRLYQPVKGSSENSRYYLVAVCENLRVAARYSSPSLSIRVEGIDIKKYSKHLVDNGFNPPSKNYTSLHLQAPSILIANKILGAIILGLGLKVSSPIPNVQVIANK